MRALLASAVARPLRDRRTFWRNAYLATLCMAVLGGGLPHETGKFVGFLVGGLLFTPLTALAYYGLLSSAAILLGPALDAIARDMERPAARPAPRHYQAVQDEPADYQPVRDFREVHPLHQRRD